MKKASASNAFNGGMIMDLNPSVTPNNVLTNCLNGTIVTFNGNENVLQNDMGNGRVETAYLPDGFIPLGTALLGGIVYIVSYNPLTDKCQIGSFPSPECNITSDEITNGGNNIIKADDFIKDKKIITTSKKVELLDNKLYPGDKFSIYSVNNGIIDNIDCLSNVGNEKYAETKKIDDEIPKNITIHVASISDEGNITILDDLLKWNGTPIYYIKNCDKVENVQKDIDNYRSLVSSAYNIFNSKYPGKLALIFYVNVINGFSVTWDVENIKNVETLQQNEKLNNIFENGVECKKQADVYLYVNWTSSHKDINPKYIILSESKYENGAKSLCNVGYYAELPDFKERENKGEDEPVKIKIETFKYNIEDDNTKKWNFEVTPAMNFGEYDLLKASGSIDFKNLGTGKIILNSWKYFIESDRMTLNWRLESYPEFHKEIKKAVFTFIPIDEKTPDELKTIVENCTSENCLTGDFATYEINNQKSWSGIFLNNISFCNLTKGLLYQNKLYLVNLCFTYGYEDSEENTEFIHIFRWLYTSDLWNDKFQLEDDFTDLELNLTADITYDITNNGQDVETDVELYPNLRYKKEPTETIYSTIGVKNKRVYFKRRISLDCELSNKKTPFTYKRISGLNIEKNDSNCYITQENYNPYSENANKGWEVIKSKLMTNHNGSLDNVKKYNNANKIVDNIRNIPLTESSNNTLVDNFYIKIDDHSDKFYADVEFHGSIFSRINADIKETSTNCPNRIKPLLYTTDDCKELGLDNNCNLKYFYTISHGDAGGNESFYWGFYLTNYIENKNENAENTLYENNDNPKLNYYWDSGNYNNYLLNWMNKSNSFLNLVIFKKLKNAGTYNNNKSLDLSGHGLIWIRTDGDHYIPIYDDFGDIDGLGPIYALKLQKNLHGLYTSIYKVELYNKLYKDWVINGLNYLKPYYENFNAKIKVNGDHFLGNDKLLLNNNYDLLEYKKALQESNINLKNITYGISINPTIITLSKKYSINMNSLIKEYNSYMSNNNYNTLYCVNGEEFLGPNLNDNNLYVWDNQKFLKLSKSQYKFINKTADIKIYEGKIYVTSSEKQNITLDWLEYISYKDNKLSIVEDRVTNNDCLIYFNTVRNLGCKVVYGLGRIYLGLGTKLNI